MAFAGLFVLYIVCGLTYIKLCNYCLNTNYDGHVLLWPRILQNTSKQISTNPYRSSAENADGLRIEKTQTVQVSANGEVSKLTITSQIDLDTLEQELNKIHNDIHILQTCTEHHADAIQCLNMDVEKEPSENGKYRILFK